MSAQCEFCTLEPAALVVELGGGETVRFCTVQCAFEEGAHRERERARSLQRTIDDQQRRIEALQEIVAAQVVSDLEKLREQQAKPRSLAASTETCEAEPP